MNREQIETEIVDINKITVHPIANENPTMTTNQFEAFKNSLMVNGQEEAIDCTYNYETFNGRHRLKALKELGHTTIKVKRQPVGTPDNELRRVADNAESRRHSTPTQLAIKAWKEYINGKYTTMAEAASTIGISVKQVERVNKIGGVNNPNSKKRLSRFNRLDIIDALYIGEQLQIPIDGNKYKQTDSLQTIINWLTATAKLELASNKPDLPTMDELTEEEEHWIIDVVDLVNKQKKTVQEELVKRLYASIHKIED